MRLLFIAALVVIEFLPALAHPCNSRHPTPENPTIILGLVGGSMMLWRSMRARLGR